MEILLILLSGLFSLIGPVILILIVVVILRHRKPVPGDDTAPKTGFKTPVSQLSPRQAVIALMVITAAYSGIAGLYVLPIWLLGITDESQIFGVRLVAGLIVLVAGVIIRQKRVIGLLLMSIGVLTMFTSMPYIFESLGSKGILLIVFLVLAALIALAVRLSHKENQA